MLTRLTPLDGEAIITLAEAKAQVRVLHNAEDALISAYRDAAIGHVERISGVALAPAEYHWELRAFPIGRIDLPMRPVTEIGSVDYSDDADAEQTYADAVWLGQSVYPPTGGDWPTAYNYAAVTFTAGLGSPDEAPELIMAAKLLLAHFYKNREAVAVGSSQVVAVPLGVDALIGSYRQVTV